MKAESRQIPQKLAARLKFVYCIHSNDNYLLTVRFISHSTILVIKEHLAKTNNLINHHGAEALRRGAQCSRNGLKPALATGNKRVRRSE